MTLNIAQEAQRSRKRVERLIYEASQEELFKAQSILEQELSEQSRLNEEINEFNRQVEAFKVRKAATTSRIAEATALVDEATNRLEKVIHEMSRKALDEEQLDRDATEAIAGKFAPTGDKSGPDLSGGSLLSAKQAQIASSHPRDRDGARMVA